MPLSDSAEAKRVPKPAPALADGADASTGAWRHVREPVVVDDAPRAS